MAARSSKEQWRGFLRRLVAESDINVLSAREAWTKLNKQFGTDVNGDDRAWVNTTLLELAQEKRDQAQRPRKKRAGQVMRASRNLRPRCSARAVLSTRYHTAEHARVLTRARVVGRPTTRARA